MKGRTNVGEARVGQRLRLLGHDEVAHPQAHARRTRERRPDLDPHVALGWAGPRRGLGPRSGTPMPTLDPRAHYGPGDGEGDGPGLGLGLGDGAGGAGGSLAGTMIGEMFWVRVSMMFCSPLGTGCCVAVTSTW